MKVNKSTDSHRVWYTTESLRYDDYTVAELASAAEEFASAVGITPEEVAWEAGIILCYNRPPTEEEALAREAELRELFAELKGRLDDVQESTSN